MEEQNRQSHDLCHCHWQSMIQMVAPYGIKLVLCRKLHLFLEKSTKTAATRAALLAQMHQIVFCPYGALPRPHWGSLQRSPDL